MAILGVLLGVTMTILGWLVYESREHRKLIIDLQNRLIHGMGERVSALERRKAVIAEAAVSQPKPIGVRRQWSENMPAAEAK
jgi:hypothetical protein